LLLSCRQGRWGEALRRLVKGQDKALRDLAAKDLAAPEDAAGRIDLGAAWDKQATVEKNRDMATACWRRSHFWYRQAELVAAGGEVAKVQGQPRSLEKRLPELADPWRELNFIDVYDGARKKDHLHFDRYREVPSRTWYKGGLDITVVARTEKASIVLAAGHGGQVMFNWEGPGGGLHLLRPNAPPSDGSMIGAGSPLDGDWGVVLGANEWHTLRWQLTETGQKVWVDNKQVFAIAEAYDLSVPRPVRILSKESPIDVKAVLIRDLGLPDVEK
jgi:hypothetical protein